MADMNQDTSQPYIEITIGPPLSRTTAMVPKHLEIRYIPQRPKPSAEIEAATP